MSIFSEPRKSVVVFLSALLFSVAFVSTLTAAGQLEESTEEPETEESSMRNRIDLRRPDAPGLAEYGSYTAGVRTVSLTNPDQLDVVSLVDGDEAARYDRELTVEVWYPAESNGKNSGVYETVSRDGTPVQLTGSSVRDAEPHSGDGAYPLVIMSHGYPGNRFLLSHFGEFLASHGYVVASIDHPESTYTDQDEFSSTLRNRALDQLFVLDEIARIGDGAEPSGHDNEGTDNEGTDDATDDFADPRFLEGLVNAERTAIIGYSMGGYGALNATGAGLSDAALEMDFGPDAAFEGRLASDSEYEESLDSRVKAVVAIAPWGMQLGIWDQDGLAGVDVPTMFMAGSVDDVSGYENVPGPYLRA